MQFSHFRVIYTQKHVITYTNNNYTGEFGVVYEGILKRDSFNETVAVKTLKGNEFSHDITTIETHDVILSKIHCSNQY